MWLSVPNPTNLPPSFLNRPLWHWAELAAALGAPASAGGPAVTGISIDSRSSQPGDLFIALAGDPGPRFFTSSPGTRDGHEFVVAAQARGAAGALVAQTQGVNLPQLRVADTLDGLWTLGRAAAQRHRGTRFAITGSSGKTTAKAFLATALQAVAEPGSMNNFWGVPVCLARTPINAPYAVYELGTNQPGEIAPLAQLVAADVAILLNVHPAHLGNFPSMAALQQEKISISNSLENISNLVCEHGVATAAGLQRQAMTFGEESGATVRLRDQLGDRATIDTPNGALEVRVPGGGRHRALTLTAVVAALLLVGEDPELAADLPTTLVPVGRGNERVLEFAGGGAWVVIDDSYNANPASMAAALTALTEADGPSYAIIGEMLELGDQTENYHQDLAPLCAGMAGVYCVGEGARSLLDALPARLQMGYAETTAEIDLASLVNALPASGRVLVKGSNRVFWQSGFCNELAAALESRR